MEPGATELHNVKYTSSDTICRWNFISFICDICLYIYIYICVYLSVYPVKSH